MIVLLFIASKTLLFFTRSYALKTTNIVKQSRIRQFKRSKKYSF